jgi:hypothetical protein
MIGVPRRLNTLHIHRGRRTPESRSRREVNLRGAARTRRRELEALLNRYGWPWSQEASALMDLFLVLEEGAER